MLRRYILANVFEYKIRLGICIFKIKYMLTVIESFSSVAQNLSHYCSLCLKFMEHF